MTERTSAAIGNRRSIARDGLAMRSKIAYGISRGEQMDWRIFAASIVGAILGSIADWIFAGLFFHERYQRHPEVWRTGASEALRIGAAQILCLLTSVAFVVLADMFALVSLSGALELAAMIWLIAPLPLLVTNSLFIKIDPLVTASHAIGWLVKLLLIACSTAIII